MAALERWVVRQAIHLIAELGREGPEPCLEVNISAKALVEPEMLPMIRHELSESGIDASNLVLEVTETAAVENITEAQDFVKTLQALGCRFALDDFGTGVSSFYLLKHLAVDYLKIDGAFVRDLPRSVVDRHLVQAMADVAQRLGVKTIAEYASDEETVGLLRKYGVDYAQGYHIGRPGPVSEVIGGRVRKAKDAA
jgi:EAL domain-containing protein (putative c-di-GMP-specific phosphodiesterase class I)